MYSQAMRDDNDNNFDGVINNLPDDKTPAQKTNADVIEEEQEKKSVLKKLQEASYDVEKLKPVNLISLSLLIRPLPMFSIVPVTLKHGGAEFRRSVRLVRN